MRRRFLLACLAFGLGACSQNATATRPLSNHYPREEIKSIVRQEARRIGVPVSLALAVAHAESNFDPNAESHAGARGVMQIMPATALGEYGITPDLLWEPRLNVRIGLHFLNRLIRRYDGRVDLALSYYNGGSAVGRLPNARVIPATRRYVIRVQKLQRQYRAGMA
ncbi:MAG: lytic transglycosylase domain-containing protein [Kiloniellales bacterium]|nr:lytic transglycosylase domain-containing protein [Kiloniellales bacterium]